MRLKLTPFRTSIALAACATVLGAFAPKQSNRSVPVLSLYQRQLDSLQRSLQLFSEDAVPGRDSTWNAHFSECRRLYKSVEYLIEYYYPIVARKMNGPALPESEAGDPAELILPTGFQVLEADVFDEDAAERASPVRREIGHLQQLVTALQQGSADLHPDATMIFDAIKLNLYRMIAKGLSGYDSPVAHQGLEEAAATVRSVYIALQTQGLADAAVLAAADKCMAALRQPAASYSGFNYAAFLQQDLSALFTALHAAQLKTRIPFAAGRHAVRSEAVSFFAAAAFDPAFFAPDSSSAKLNERRKLGERLFRDTRLSGGGRSCATCHKPEAFYADGLRVNTSLQRDAQLLRNTPTLLNAALQPALFWDGRTRFLEDQAHDVITSKAEMDGDAERIEAALAADQVYKRLFRAAFPDARRAVTEKNSCIALAVYIRSLVRMDAAFDKYMRGDPKAMTAQQQRGLNLFMGKANCGSCHFMPLFNGTTPPDYTRSEGDVIGVPGSPDFAHPQPDADRGMYLLFKVRHQDGAFKTPTLRHIAHTAPYMHNGVYKSLEEVVDFYDRGGGAGLGLNIPMQTLASDSLKLSVTEKAALVAFLKAL
jgi:cytochrome c peroxidase